MIAEGVLAVETGMTARDLAETIHAHAHLRVLGGVKDSVSNLKEAIAGEAHEFKSMYPDFLAEAEKEDNKPAIYSFKNALAVEEIHHSLFSKALEAVKGGGDLPATSIHICPVCGNTVEGGVPDACPICNVPGSKFVEIA